MNIEGRRNLLSQLMESNTEASNEDTKPQVEEKSNTVNDNIKIANAKPISEVNPPDNKDLPKESQPENKAEQPTVTDQIESSDKQTENEISEEFPFKLEESTTEAEQLTIKREENDFSLTLAPILGFSPRALKRFVNVYLLIKVGLSDLQWRIYFEKVHPKTGEKDALGTIRNYQAVMFLLAVITGLPATSRILFRTLRTKTLKTLGELFEQIDVIKKEDKWFILGSPADEISIKKKLVERGLTDIMPKQEVADLNIEINKYNMELELLQFTKWLDREKRDWFTVDLDQLRYWDPVVSRYSFRVEPIDQD